LLVVPLQIEQHLTETDRRPNGQWITMRPPIRYGWRRHQGTASIVACTINFPNAFLVRIEPETNGWIHATCTTRD
jgi:hypothetical protein